MVTRWNRSPGFQGGGLPPYDADAWRSQSERILKPVPTPKDAPHTPEFSPEGSSPSDPAPGR
jgi:hypothetical protein